VTDQQFYSAFTDRHRGPRELVSSRLKADYLPLLTLLGQWFPAGEALDLGCGRGEWLEILKDCGLAAHGIDLDEAMLAGCREQGLGVTHEDALSACRGATDESQVLVSAFHLVEHLPLEAVRELIEEARRALKPGGLLILETPNPENLVVGTSGFFLDPTHQRPIPLHLLIFLAEYAGFAQVKVLRLHEAPGLAGKTTLTLLDVLGGVSPDYAIVAQKAGSDEQMTITAQTLAEKKGLTLEALAWKYDRQKETRLEQAESRALCAEEELRSLLTSRSWRLTQPLRDGTQCLRRLRAETSGTPGTGRRYGEALASGLAALKEGMAPVQAALREHIRVRLYRFPRLKALLSTLFWKATDPQTDDLPLSKEESKTGHLTARTRHVKAELLAAVRRHRKEKK
jgi:O-antigen chain-terminating methyltransferase